MDVATRLMNKIYEADMHVSDMGKYVFHSEVAVFVQDILSMLPGPYEAVVEQFKKEYTNILESKQKYRSYADNPIYGLAMVLHKFAMKRRQKETSAFFIEVGNPGYLYRNISFPIWYRAHVYLAREPLLSMGDIRPYTVQRFIEDEVFPALNTYGHLCTYWYTADTYTSVLENPLLKGIYSGYLNSIILHETLSEAHKKYASDAAAIVRRNEIVWDIIILREFLAILGISPVSTRHNIHVMDRICPGIKALQDKYPIPPIPIKTNLRDDYVNVANFAAKLNFKYATVYAYTVQPGLSTTISAPDIPFSDVLQILSVPPQ